MSVLRLEDFSTFVSAKCLSVMLNEELQKTRNTQLRQRSVRKPGNPPSLPQLWLMTQGCRFASHEGDWNFPREEAEGFGNQSTPSRDSKCDSSTAAPGSAVVIVQVRVLAPKDASPRNRNAHSPYQTKRHVGVRSAETDTTRNASHIPTEVFTSKLDNSPQHEPATGGTRAKPDVRMGLCLWDESNSGFGDPNSRQRAAAPQSSKKPGQVVRGWR
ncbi:hypothetical protein LZ30DRAFT_683753 [Colletotrichum cereale]|nr:hypothetical protein LZ30DRAFT_683753 [Colletotrichum cereale]